MPAHTHTHRGTQGECRDEKENVKKKKNGKNLPNPMSNTSLYIQKSLV
jgi:hypothetical protein